MRRVRDGRGVALVLEREVERRRCAKAVACGAETGHALRLERGDDRVDRGEPRIGGVPRKPPLDVKAGIVQVIFVNGIFEKDVRHDDFKAVARKIIGE